MKIQRCPSKDMPGTAVAPLTDEEASLLRYLRCMRPSARKMILDLSAEYAREFPDPEKYALGV